jgi:N-methylhydantoinase B/oxoprolinase/acetone carboxylase alpha subunit
MCSAPGLAFLSPLTGSSPQVDWGGNVVYNFTYAYVHMAVKNIFDPDIPTNDGAAAPIRLIAPEGTVVNCRRPAAVTAVRRSAIRRRQHETSQKGESAQAARLGTLEISRSAELGAPGPSGLPFTAKRYSLSR